MTDREKLPDRRVGEIRLRSNCMLTEYYKRPGITAEAIVDGWYHTGDMGYIMDGELFITGRKKDLIIVGGKNIYPQDLEAIANHIPGIYPGRAVAFGLLDERIGSEVIVMVAELKPDLDGLTPAEIERQSAPADCCPDRGNPGRYAPGRGALGNQNLQR